MRIAGLGPIKLVYGCFERSPNFSEVSSFIFDLSLTPLKLVNTTSGMSTFYLVLPKLVADGEISSLIKLLLGNL